MKAISYSLSYSSAIFQVVTKNIREVMNVKQVAEYLGLSVDAVRKRCQRKQLPYHLNAKHLYFSKLEVDATLLNRKRYGSEPF